MHVYMIIYTLQYENVAILKYIKRLLGEDYYLLGDY